MEKVSYAEYAPIVRQRIIAHVEHMGWPVLAVDWKTRKCPNEQLFAMLLDDAHLQRKAAEARVAELEARDALLS